MSSGLTEGLVAFGAVAAVATPFFYLTVPWYRRRTGWAVMTMAVALALVYVLLFTTIVLGNPLPDWMRNLIYALVAVGLWVELILLVHVNRTGRDRIRDDIDERTGV